MKNPKFNLLICGLLIGYKNNLKILFYRLLCDFIIIFLPYGKQRKQFYRQSSGSS